MTTPRLPGLLLLFLSSSFFYLSTENLRSCDLHSALLLLKEHGVDLLLQGCNYDKELLLSGLEGGGHQRAFSLLLLLLVRHWQ